MLGQLTIQSQKVKRSMANISFVMNTVPVETAAELQERLGWIKQHWEPLAGRVRHRMAQMKFEKAQKVCSLYQTLTSVFGVCLCYSSLVS